MSRVLLATRNRHKLIELERILAPSLPVRVLGLDDVPAFPELPESGATFAENALIKAREAARRTGLIALADDSGLAVDALNGMPGVLSARWAGLQAVDATGQKLPGADRANLELLLAQLADVPPERRAAAFVCAVALVLPGGVELTTEARMPGRVIGAPRGANGFGYDPIFVPDGLSQTSAELEPDVKDGISHRGRALQAMLPHLLAAMEQHSRAGGP